MSRRGSLAQATPAAGTHTGLWLDRFVPTVGATAAASQHFAATLEAVRVPPGYTAAFRRVATGLAALPPHTELREALVRGRLVVGLGAESVLETAITLHRTWGVPYLPGSALKGLAARAARQRLDPPWEVTSEPYQVLFGDTTSAGHLTFHDALWIPFDTRTGTAATKQPLAFDVMTVHHPDYYSGKDVPPADWDDPNPVPFLTAQGSYLVALTGPPRWVEVAFEILKGALAEDGLGAKTAAGYGRMGLRAWDGLPAES